MRGFNWIKILLFASLVMLAAANCAGAQYWFQSGVVGSGRSNFNNGTSASIQTIWQNVSNGSFGFWVGENLENDAFVQVGYQVINESGYYPEACGPSGCNGSVLLTAGEPAWFWEYFPANYNGGNFYGGIGSDGSAGANGTFNNYSFRSNGDVWTAYFNNQSIGSVNLNAPGSGVNTPTAVGELAGTDTNTQPMKKVVFRNLKFYSGSNSSLVPTGIGYVSYGKSSSTTLINLYGVEEVGNKVNYFEVGSGLPQNNRDVLWNMGYQLSVVSEYGNLSDVENYSAYSTTLLHAPMVVSISNGTRAIFLGWKGSGAGSYTGSRSSASVEMYSNIVETAMWKVQYYIGTNSTYPYPVGGAGWYDANSTAHLSAGPSIIGMGNSTRSVFVQWSNGADKNSTAMTVVAPETLTVLWSKQYMVNATTPYGTVAGTGWYDDNSVAVLQLNGTATPAIGGVRTGFYGWSDGYGNSTVRLLVTSPISISAIFKKQYLMTLNPEDAYGDAIAGVDYYNVNGTNSSASSLYLFANMSYTVDYMHYKGVSVPLNYMFDTNAPKTVSFGAPVYNIRISAVSALETPVNASINVTFGNGTRLVSYLGSGGQIDFDDVPYGSVNGEVSYDGVSKSLALSGGVGQSKFLFITPSLIAVTIMAIAAAVLSGRFAKNRLSDS
jgi:hypothetical protein